MDVARGPAQVELTVGQAAHAGAGRRRLAGPHPGVGDHDDVARETIAALLEQRGEVRRARLLLALHDQLEVDGGAGPSGRFEVSPDAEGVEEDLALVVSGAAPVQPLAFDRRLERRVLPRARAASPAARRGGRRRRQSARLRRRWATPRRRPADPAVSHTSTVGNPVARNACASHSADRRTSAALAGSPEMDGMRSHSTSSATKRSAPDSTAARTEPRSVMRRTIRISARANHRRRLASGRCASPPSTCCTAGP